MATAGVTIQGNIIGANAAGLRRSLQFHSGIDITNSTGVTVGGTGTGARQPPLRQPWPAAWVSRAAAASWWLATLIGTDLTGAIALPNMTGVSESGTTGLTLGGTTAAARNVISGNELRGVSLLGGTNIVVQGNYIGLTASGSTAPGNGTERRRNRPQRPATPDQQHHRRCHPGRRQRHLGQRSATASSSIPTSGAVDVQGNFIGTDSTGMNAVPNGGDGIQVGVGDSSLTIAGNFIWGNAGNGINLLSSPALIQNNFIGTNATGSAALPNGANGILVKSSTNTIGGGPGAGNLISGNTLAGIAILGTKNQVLGNQIGTNALGTAAVPNAIGISDRLAAVAAPTAAPARYQQRHCRQQWRRRPYLLAEQHGIMGLHRHDQSERCSAANGAVGIQVTSSNNTVPLGRKLAICGNTGWPASSWTLRGHTDRWRHDRSTKAGTAWLAMAQGGVHRLRPASAAQPSAARPAVSAT